MRGSCSNWPQKRKIVQTLDSAINLKRVQIGRERGHKYWNHYNKQIMKYNWIVLFHVYSFLGSVILSRADHDHDWRSANVTGVVGAIVDDSCRGGKEERVAIKMALQDFHQATNQSLTLHMRSSRGDPMQAALAG